MSTVSDLGLDLENLFQPAWAQGKTEANRFEEFTGDEGVKPERRRGGDRGERRGPRRERAGGGEPSGERRGPRPPRAGGKFGDRKKGFSRRDDRREREHREPPAPLPDMGVVFLPDDKGVESIARQIKMTGRAYPLFEIARLILQKPERYAVRLDVKQKPDGAVAQPLFVCALDDTPWLSEDEAVAHVLKNHFATFYQTERTATEPPKGRYTFVAQCGMSGVILGPPNYHDYQNQLRKLHATRFPRMPFDAFKSRVKIVKDEAVVQKWIEDQSFKTEYICLNMPEPLKLPSMEEVEKHFRATHKETIVKQVETATVDGVKSRNLRCNGLYRVIRAEWEQQRRFPLQLSTELSREFAGHGLQFFKVNKSVVHVSVARPQFLDLETTPVSENVKRIVGHINAHPKCTRRELVETLAPSPAVIEIKPEAETPAGSESSLQAASADGSAAGDVAAAGKPPEGGTPNVVLPKPQPTPEQTAVIADLHWLIHQGHVLEFADGRMETAKKPLPRPPKPEKKPAQAKPATEGEVTPATEPPLAAEAAIAPTAEGEVTPVTEATPQVETPVEPAVETQIAPEASPEIKTPVETAAEAAKPAAEVQAPVESVAEPSVEPDTSTKDNTTPSDTAAHTPEAAPSDSIPSPSQSNPEQRT